MNKSGYEITPFVEGTVFLEWKTEEERLRKMSKITCMSLAV